MSNEKENGYSQDEVVTLTDEVGRELTCYIEQSLEVNSQDYLLLRPVDETVEIFAWEEGLEEDLEEEAILIEDDETIDEIFPIARAVLQEQDLTLKRTAYALTVAGEPPPLDEENILTLEIEEEGNQLEPEQLQFLANFYNEEQEYEIYRRIDPLLLFGRVNQTGKIELLSPEEFQKVQPAIENQLALLEDEMFDELE